MACKPRRAGAGSVHSQACGAGHGVRADKQVRLGTKGLCVLTRRLCRPCPDTGGPVTSLGLDKLVITVGLDIPSGKCATI